MEVPRLGVKSELQLPAYTTAQSNARSLIHWARPGIEPTPSWILVSLVTTELKWELTSLFIHGNSRAWLTWKVSPLGFSVLLGSVRLKEGVFFESNNKSGNYPYFICEEVHIQLCLVISARIFRWYVVEACSAWLPCCAHSIRAQQKKGFLFPRTFIYLFIYLLFFLSF